MIEKENEGVRISISIRIRMAFVVERVEFNMKQEAKVLTLRKMQS